MQFNSYIFILLFLPLTIMGYFGIHSLGKEKPAKIYLLLMSLWFYGYFNVSYLVIICGSIVVNFCIFLLMKRKPFLEKGKPPRKLLLLAGILFNVAIIFYFKYYDFFVQNLNDIFKTNFVLRHIALPLGISFFTFQQISFVVDAYHGECDGYNFLEYALFVTFFPQLVAGPIVLHSELIPQFNNPSKWKVDYDNLSKGIMIFVRGLSKKVLLADVLGNVVNAGFAQAALIPAGEGALTMPEIIIVMVCFTFQLYFAFSGYSDMATGLGLMLNLIIPKNFNSPYKAISVADYWKRWHMTLTRFLTRYIYIPLGGNRKGTVRTYLNIMAVFLVSGIWHGANWTYILWGILHGVANCFNRATEGIYKSLMKKIESLSFGKILKGAVTTVFWILNFTFISVALLLFRSDTVTQWVQMMKRLPVYNYDVRLELIEPLRIPKLTALMSALGLNSSDGAVLGFSCGAYLLLSLFICLCTTNNYDAKYKRNLMSVATTGVLFILCIVSLSTISTFLYFNF